MMLIAKSKYFEYTASAPQKAKSPYIALDPASVHAFFAEDEISPEDLGYYEKNKK